MERALLAGLFALLPLQESIPAIGQFSFLWILFALLAGYTVLYRPRALAKTFTHPVFLAASGLIFVGLLIESLHPNISFWDPNSSYGEMLRILQMVIGAVLVASLCRDRPALRACIYGYIIAALWLSGLLMMTSYSALSTTAATNFAEASQVRAQVFTGMAIRGNLNGMSFFSVQGFIAALAFYLKSTVRYKRVIFIVIALFCLVAASLPLSRGGFLIAIVTAVLILLKHRGKYLRSIIAVVLISAGMLIWFPHVLFSRLTFSTSVTEGKMEARARVYTAVVEHFPEYSSLGVGSGNFWHEWGYNHGFNNGYITVGAHNCFVQVMIYWGVLGLLALIALMCAVYKCLPTSIAGNDELVLCVYGIAVSLSLWMLFVHTIYSKEFSLGLGLLVAARRWIWPVGFGSAFSLGSNHY